ncbi:MAG: 2-oxo-hepta-3-ene-1,7-dioic acid hydratase [Rhizobiaceae bacterium]|nr:2-oxo-hepta-3-ene-1,7-dioic acid hydratase [Rhizobiaceae bacterium]MCV0407527.1 2-oxo-hepta-3-ene-1,7-dioic acid hydratase [Rhizobiaceae bacterium]
MLGPTDIDAAANALLQAEETRKQIGLLSLQHPGMTMDDAYSVQSALVKRKLEAGRKVIGWKIGLTSKAMQYALNIDTPDSGVLFDDMVFEDGATIPADRFIQPRVEAEVAFVMKAPLRGPGVTPDDVLAATEYAIPALEILDTRIRRVDPETKRARNICDTIADNAANAGIVTGGQHIDPTKTDLRWIGAIVSRNGEVEETGLGAGVMNDPALGIAWLANRLAEYGDEGIEAGQIVLAGSFIRPIEAQSGSTIHADFGPHGSVNLHFA